MPADAFYEWKVVEGGKQPYAIGGRPSRSVCNPGRRHQIDCWATTRDNLPVSRNRTQVVSFTIAAILTIAPAVAGTPLDLSADPPKTRIDSGPSLSLGRVGPCPGCRTEPQNGLYNFITPKGPRPIEPVPGILLRIPLSNAAR